MSEELYAPATSALLRHYRIEAGLTTEDVAHILDVSVSHMHHLFQGRRIPSVDIAAQLTKLLNVPADVFFDAVRQDRPIRPQQEARKKRRRESNKQPVPASADEDEWENA